MQKRTMIKSSFVGFSAIATGTPCLTTETIINDFVTDYQRNVLG
jgi:hypothetical protein